MTPINRINDMSVFTPDESARERHSKAEIHISFDKHFRSYSERIFKNLPYDEIFRQFTSFNAHAVL